MDRSPGQPVGGSLVYDDPGYRPAPFSARIPQSGLRGRRAENGYCWAPGQTGYGPLNEAALEFLYIDRAWRSSKRRQSMGVVGLRGETERLFRYEDGTIVPIDRV
jgi:hypothetical protein